MAKESKGYALHFNLNTTRTEALPDSPPAAPNPEVWPLKHKKEKGWVLEEEDGTEIERDVEID